MLYRSCAAALLLGSVATSSFADSLDINLHNDAFRGTYTHNMQSANYGQMVDVGLLYAENELGKNENLWHAGFSVSGKNWSDAGNFDIALGGRVIYTSPGKYDLMALAFGGNLRFSPMDRFGIGAQLYYAPAITSLMDADGYIETGVSMDYQLLPHAFIYLGHRYIELDVEDVGDVEADDHVHIGMKLMF